MYEQAPDGRPEDEPYDEVHISHERPSSHNTLPGGRAAPTHLYDTATRCILEAGTSGWILRIGFPEAPNAGSPVSENTSSETV